MKRLLLLLTLPALLIIAAGSAFWLLWAGAGPTSRQMTIVVDQGSSIARVAQQLEQAGAIRGNATTFRGLARLFGAHAPVQSGEFLLSAGISPEAILYTLQFGHPVQRMVTIPEGMPSVQVQARLMAVPFLTGAVDVPAEGSVLPDTYGYRRGESRAAVLGRMQAAMRTELARLWARRRPGALVVSPEAAIILASIVEKETGKASERRLIAGVYGNRLRRGMPIRPSSIQSRADGRSAGASSSPSSMRTTATTPTEAPACRSGRSPIQGGIRLPPCSIRRRPMHSTSSLTAPAATSSRTRSSSIRPMSRAGTQSAAPAARCD